MMILRDLLEAAVGSSIVFVDRLLLEEVFYFLSRGVVVGHLFVYYF